MTSRRRSCPLGKKKGKQDAAAHHHDEGIPSIGLARCGWENPHQPESRAPGRVLVAPYACYCAPLSCLELQLARAPNYYTRVLGTSCIIHGTQATCPQDERGNGDLRRISAPDSGKIGGPRPRPGPDSRNNKAQIREILSTKRYICTHTAPHLQRRLVSNKVELK